MHVSSVMYVFCVMCMICVMCMPYAASVLCAVWGNMYNAHGVRFVWSVFVLRDVYVVESVWQMCNVWKDMYECL